jgi:glucokinase
MANLVSVLNPQMIVLGGGLMQAAELFLEPAVRTMREWAQPVAAAEVRVEVTRLGEDAGLLGAARIAFDSVSQGKE